MCSSTVSLFFNVIHNSVLFFFWFFFILEGRGCNYNLGRNNKILKKKTKVYLVYYFSPLLSFFFFNKGAEPTDLEKDAYTKVESVLSKAPAIIEELKAYQGAGEAIRNVKKKSPSSSPSHLPPWSFPPSN